MSYEYKDTIQDSIIHYYDHVLLYSEYTDDVLKELDHVYAQATKADEYEKSKHRTHVNDFKAEAFDAILKAYDETFSREHMAYEVSHIIEVYESGKSHVKK